MRSFHVPETPFTSAWPPSLPSVAYFPGHACNLGGERPQLVHHRVHRFAGTKEFALQRAAVDLKLEALRKIALSHGPDNAGYFGRRLGKVSDERVYRIDARFPSARSIRHRGTLGDLSFFADNFADAFQFRSEHLVLLDDLVQNLAHLPGGAVQTQRQTARKIALSNRIQNL